MLYYRDLPVRTAASDHDLLKEIKLNLEEASRLELMAKQVDPAEEARERALPKPSTRLKNRLKRKRKK